MTDRLLQLERRLNLKKYLAELTIFAGRVVREEELLPLGTIEPVREQSKILLQGKPVKTWNIPFRDLRSEYFDRFVTTLYELNPSPVYVWTHRTNTCGLFQAPSIRAINFRFDFWTLSEGIVDLLASDLRDDMQMDWEESADSRKVQIKFTGDNWTRAVF